MRIDRLEVQFGELAAEMRSGFRDVDQRLCKIEARLEQTATKAALSEVEAGLKAALSAVQARLDQTATKAEIQDSRIEMYKNSADMKTWLLATMITIIALFCVALFGLHRWNG